MEDCKSCVHWGIREEDRYCGVLTPLDTDTGEEMELPYKVKYCNSPDVLFYERPVKPNQACVVDGSEYMAKLITGPEYGCVNHKEKV